MPFHPILLSPFPYVDLSNPTCPPKDGGLVPLNNYCAKKSKTNPACQQFYQALAKEAAVAGGLFRQCPRGFTAYAFLLAGTPVAFTGVIPAPRLGGDQERQRAKDHSEAKVAKTFLNTAAEALVKADLSLSQGMAERLKVYPSALHEIRKYNRTIKQEAERLCMAQSPGDLDQAQAPLVCILKSSELMTYQFEILELIANEDLASLPTNNRAHVYRLFDKCTRILRLTAEKKNVSIDISGDNIQAMVCDKTFPIIATVLLENAVKYAVPHTAISVRVARVSPARGEVSVTNVGPPPVFHNPNEYFNKYTRGKPDGSGMGFGLYLAQLVGTQHHASISLHIQPQNGNPNHHVWRFMLSLPIIAPPAHD